MSEPKMAPYPESDKLVANSQTRRDIADFLEWCEQNKMRLGKFTEYPAAFQATYKSHDDLIFEYLGVDSKKLEAERRKMLDDLSNM